MSQECIQEWHTLLTRYDLSTSRSSCLNQCEALQVLNALRTSNVRRPDIVLQLGQQIETNCTENELYMLYEQMFVAALDMKSDKRANMYLQKLEKQFPNSTRVMRLQGMVHEAKGNYDAAIAIYNKLLVDNPTDLSVLERTVATYKAQGNLGDALFEMNKLLALNQGDYKAWTEVADIHIRISNYTEAAFCMEEAVLRDPYNHLLQIRLAELYYTQGGLKNLIIARTHYSDSLNVLSSSINVRALYGLMLCCLSIQEIGIDLSTEDKAVNVALLEWAKEELLELVDKSESSAFIYNGILGCMAVTKREAESK